MRAAPLVSVAGACLLGACAAPPLSESRLPAVGYSGMAQVDPQTYLVVHDVKGSQASGHFGLLRLRPDEPPRYQPLPTDWRQVEGPAQDLEAVCALPGHPGEFLAAESSGRIFRLALQDDRVRVRHALPPPGDSTSRPDANYEGLACAGRRDGAVLLILGERGGSARHPSGGLHWGLVDPVAGTVQWQPVTKAVAAPGRWNDASTPRAIADLYLDAGNRLWAAASEDGGETGPFRSIIYLTAVIRPEAEDPLVVTTPSEAAWSLDGVKVEAIAGPADAVPDSALSVATDDEELGGIWRPLYRSLTEEGPVQPTAAAKTP